MEDEAIEVCAVIKQIDNEIAGLLKEREAYRQKLCTILPNIDNVIPEMVLMPKEYEIEKDKVKQYGIMDKKSR